MIIKAMGNPTISDNIGITTRQNLLCIHNSDLRIQIIAKYKPAEQAIQIIKSIKTTIFARLSITYYFLGSKKLYSI